MDVFVFLHTFGNVWEYFAKVANLDFFRISSRILAHLATFKALLRILKICKNFQFFSDKFLYFDFDEICVKITF